MPTGNSFSQINLYIARQASNPARYILEIPHQLMLGWIPSIIGIGIRAFLYRLMLRMDGWAAIDQGVRLRFPSNIRLGHGAYIDERAYLHACPSGIRIGDRSIVMHGAVLHTYNFRSLPHAFIEIGEG